MGEEDCSSEVTIDQLATSLRSRLKEDVLRLDAQSKRIGIEQRNNQYFVVKQ